MTEEEKEAKWELFSKEMAALLTEPDDTKHTIGVMVNIELDKMRFGVFRNIMFMVEMNEPPEEIAARKEEFYRALFVAGLDDLAKTMTEKMLGNLLEKLAKDMQKEKDKED